MRFKRSVRSIDCGENASEVNVHGDVACICLCAYFVERGGRWSKIISRSSTVSKTMLLEGATAAGRFSWTITSLVKMFPEYHTRLHVLIELCASFDNGKAV